MAVEESAAVPPVADRESAFYWDGLRAHRLLVQRCAACGRHRFPPMPACPHCGAVGGETVELDGRGTVYSWIVVHRAFNPALASDVPYTVATVELAPGCRTVGRVEGDAALAAGDAVAPLFVDHEGWTELRFRPVP
ncbi:MAG TPA: OB-fold domain-containing protein [Acidimicrobiia bacterium]|nr:OB-fold domain-containing protein [Acidimicrobiia bacterium]